MRTTTGWHAAGPRDLERTELRRRELRADDLAVRVDYCGVCHSDVHALAAFDAQAGTPLVP
ncbi:alcohol dehydrogenase catalytic domain-containing protein, partial [Streptomyces sp. SID11233]|nr:alcohol dehydrogenase catalytic domain-containing protein [Streptomyces sp. SID11233]